MTRMSRLPAALRTTSQVGELSRKGARGPTRPWRRPIVVMWGEGTRVGVVDSSGQHQEEGAE
jgi:hypothetical protein